MLQFDTSVTPRELDDNDSLQTGLLILLFFVEAIAAIPFLMWVHRVVRNLPALGARDPRFSPAWAVGWWFIPIASFVQPLRALIEAWKASDPAIGPTDRAARSRLPGSPVLIIWWLLWIVGNLMLSTGLSARSRAIDKAESGVGVTGTVDALKQVRTMDAQIAVAMVLLIIAVVLVIVIMQSLTARQERKSQQPRPPGAWYG